LRWILRGENRVVTVSRVQGDLAFSLPCIVGASGAGAPLAVAMDGEERARRARLARSAEVLTKVMSQIA
jgi:malate/lactate dehydrogenase